MHPHFYALRFQKFMTNVVLANKDKNKRISQSNRLLYIDEQTKQIIKRVRKQISVTASLYDYEESEESQS